MACNTNCTCVIYTGGALSSIPDVHDGDNLQNILHDINNAISTLAPTTTTLIGDVTGIGSATIPTILRTVNTTPGVYGSSTQVPQFHVNAKGLITDITNISIAGGGGGAPTGPAGGDLGGTYPNPTVVWSNGNSTYDVRYVPLTRTITINGTTLDLSANRSFTTPSGTVTSVAVSSTDLSVSGSSITSSGTITLNINSAAVSYAKVQNVAATSLLGNPTGSPASMSEITLGTGLAFSGTTVIVSANTTNQKVNVLGDGVSIGTRKAINFISGSNMAITAIDNSSSDRIDVTFDATAGGGGGTPGGSDTQLQYNNAGSFGGTAAGIYATTGNLFTFTSQAAANIPVTVKGAASQLGDLQRWVNSASAILAKIDSAGNITATNLSGTNTGNQTITLTGNVTGSGTGSFATTIAARAVTYGMMPSVTAQKLLGRFAASAGNAQEITLGSGLALDSSTGILSVTSGGTGTVTSVGVSGANGIGVTGTPIITSGTISLTLGNITPITVNGLTLVAGSTGFTIAGGVTSKVLTVSNNSTLSGTNTGDVTLSGQNYLSISGQMLAANPVDLSTANVTGVLVATSFPALTGDVTTVSGALNTTIATGAVTTTKIAAAAVTYAKIQNVSVTNRLLGRSTAGAGPMEEITIGSGLSLSGGVLTGTGGSGPSKVFQTLTDATTITWTYTSGFNAELILSVGTPPANHTINMVGDASGDYGTLFVTQGSPGGFKIRIPSGDFFLDGINVVGSSQSIDLNEAVGALNILTFVRRGTVRYWTMGWYHQ